MNDEGTGWRIAWNMTQNVNDLTQEIITLKEKERQYKNEKMRLIKNYDILKRKFYHLQKEKEKEKEKKSKSFWKCLFCGKN